MKFYAKIQNYFHISKFLEKFFAKIVQKYRCETNGPEDQLFSCLRPRTCADEFIEFAGPSGPHCCYILSSCIGCDRRDRCFINSFVCACMYIVLSVTSVTSLAVASSNLLILCALCVLVGCDR